MPRSIDDGRSDATHGPKYQGCYDDRMLEPGDLNELNGLVRDKPWADDRIEKVLAKLYDGLQEYAEAHAELDKEAQSLHGRAVGRPSPKLERRIEEVEREQEENREWFKSFDRRVYLLHVQMADRVDKGARRELVERYRFHREVQRLYQESRKAFTNADNYLSAYAAAGQGEINVGPEFVGEMQRTLRDSWKSLKNIVRDAREINPPAMKNFEEGDDLAGFILEGKMVPEPPTSYAKGAWINNLIQQLQGVRQKCFRLHFKSVGGILRLQEKIAVRWQAGREPVDAELVDAEPAAPRAIPAEVVPAEVVAAEVIEAEVIEAEVLPDEPVPAPAAFVAPQPPVGPAALPSQVFARGESEPPTPAAGGDLFSLDADELSAGAPKPIPGAEAPVAEPKLPAAPARPFGLTLSLDGEADLGFPSVPTAPGVKPASGKRPPVRITIVRPGERSPLAK